MYMVYMEEDGSQHRGDSPTLFEKLVSSLSPSYWVSEEYWVGLRD